MGPGAHCSGPGPRAGPGAGRYGLGPWGNGVTAEALWASRAGRERSPGGGRLVRGAATGLLGRDGVEGALLITPCNGVHTFRMRFAIDVAYLDRRLNVVAVKTMRPGRMGRISLRARHVLEAEAGAMARWG